MSYCGSRFATVRRPTREVKVGPVGVGGSNPIRLQSMTTSDTEDIAATVRQSIALAEVGCEIVRITAPNVAAARALKRIRAEFTAAGFGAVPLVADIHFLPQAAMEAVEHVEKVRVNPGNYADRKKFAVREYSDSDYAAELERLHEAFTPLVLRAKALGRSLRIGTNHGSLSDRIMNRYGDTPLGMVESALEFLRIAEGNGFRDSILSMKSSNPKVMIEAYRLLVERMRAEDMHYPLHLGVTEAGDGEDGRIKSAIGIGSLLLDGLGDTIRVSLTEDSVYEIPVARALADKAMSQWHPLTTHHSPLTTPDPIDPYHYSRRETNLVRLGRECAAGPEQPPRVIVRAPSVEALPAVLASFLSPALRDTPAEGVLVPVASAADIAAAASALRSAPAAAFFLALELAPAVDAGALHGAAAQLPRSSLIVRSFRADESAALAAFTRCAHERELLLAAACAPEDLPALGEAIRQVGDERMIFTVREAAVRAEQDSAPTGVGHEVGRYRRLAAGLAALGSRAPIWIRNTEAAAVQPDPSFLSRLLEASILTGSLLCDGIGDLVSIETGPDPVRALKLSYNVLQGAGSRISKAEFVACPSCGRTLFDLQATTQRIRSRTAHLKGVKIAIMGCIVNGPGEMADAHFGYVGGAPGKINLYVGKQCVQYNVPQAEADERLVALIREHGRWVDPEPVHA